jgi:NAD(P)-dependent dehydrogenase (short-subunit alcohol dehydrogenase family)
MKSVIVGGSSGMGLGIAKALLKQNHEVVICSRNKEKLENAKKALGSVETHVLDVTNEKQVAEVFFKIGAFDHLVTTAADFISGPFLEMKLQEAKSFFDSKFWGQYLCAKSAAPFIRKGGTITFFCGVAGQKPMPHFAAGCAINAAVEGLTRALAVEIAPIRVNAIAPGWVATPVWDGVAGKEAQFKAKAEKLPVKRVGTTDDIAKAALFLMDCGYATGTVLYVDGGDLLV